MSGDLNTATPVAGNSFSSKIHAGRQFDAPTVELARDALSYIPADCDRTQWIKIGGALRHEFGEAGFDLFDEWSQRSPDQYDSRGTLSAYRSLKGGISNPSTFKTIAGMARDAGWVPSSQARKMTPAESQQRALDRALRDAKSESEAVLRRAGAAGRAEACLDGARPYTADDAANNDYLKRHGHDEGYGAYIGPFTKTDPSTGEITVVSNHALLLPIMDLEKKVHSVQAIFPDADNSLKLDKIYLKYGAKRGHFFRIGQPTMRDGKYVVLIAEGFATACSLHKSTGHCVFTAFDAGNLKPVAEIIRAKLSDATIVLCADNDAWTSGNPGRKNAYQAAAAVGGLVAIPEFDKALGDDGRKGPTDFNDLAMLNGTHDDAVVLAVIEAVLAANVVVTQAAVDALNAPAVVVPDLLAGIEEDDDDQSDYEQTFGGRVVGFDDEKPVVAAPWAVGAVTKSVAGAESSLSRDLDQVRDAVRSTSIQMTVEDMKVMLGKCQSVEALGVSAEKIRAQNISDADLALLVPHYQNLFKLRSDGRSVSIADSRRALRQIENSAERAVVAELNKQHAVVLAGDKAVVLRESPRATGEPGFEVLLLSESAFRMFYRNRTVDIMVERDGETRKKTVPIADWWMKSADRRQYEGITFAPGIPAHPDYYNLWHGYAVEPRAGSLFSNAMKCRRLLSHIKMNVCRGNRDHFRYLLAWAADMLQDPGKKKGVALVLRGNKGSGKSKVAEVFASLLGQHSIKIAQMKHLVGNFNRHLANKLLVVAEESFWAGDKADDGPLKDMITSSTLTLEAKGIDAIEMKSFARIMMITNNSWAVPATSDERRYFVLDVGNDRREDHEYFAAIDKQLDDNDQEGRTALLSFLLAFDLSTVNLRKVPETAALREQRGLSLEPHDQFVYDALIDRQIAGVSWEWSTEVSKEEVYNAYIDAGRKRSKSHLMAKNRFTSRLEKFGIKARKGTTGNRAPVYWLPEWSVAAEKFQATTGVDLVALGETVEESTAF